MSEPSSHADLDALAQVFKVMGHEVRLRLLRELWQSGERSVGELETLTGIGQPGLSQQLGVLRNAELVSTRREAKLVFYSLAPQAFASASTLLGHLAGSAARADNAGTPAPRSHVRGSAATFAKIL